MVARRKNTVSPIVFIWIFMLNVDTRRFLTSCFLIVFSINSCYGMITSEGPNLSLQEIYLRKKDLGGEMNKYLPSSQVLIADEDFDNGITCAALSPDGSLLALGDCVGLTMIFHVESGRLLQDLASGKNFAISKLKWSPDSQYLLVHGASNQPAPEVVIWKRDLGSSTFKRVSSIEDKDAVITAVDFVMHDLEKFIALNTEQEIFKVPLGQNLLPGAVDSIVSLPQNEGFVFERVSICADQRYIIAVVTNIANSISALCLVDATSKNASKLISLEQNCISYDISPHDNIVVVTTRGVDTYCLDGNDDSKHIKKLVSRSNDASLDCAFYSSNSDYIVEMVDQKGGAWLRRKRNSHAPARLAVRNTSGVLLTDISIDGENFKGEVKFLDASVLGHLLTIVLCDEDNVWVVSTSIFNPVSFQSHRQHGGGFKGGKSKKLVLSLDDDKRIWASNVAS